MAFFRTNKIDKNRNFKCILEWEKHILGGGLEGGQSHESEEDEGDESYEVGRKDKWDPSADSRREETNERRGKANDEEGYKESHSSCTTTNSMENEDNMENMTNVKCESNTQVVEGDFLWSVISALNGGEKSRAVRLRGGDKHAEQVVHNIPQIRLSKKYVDVGCLGTWKLSSSKSISDTKKLKDNNVNTYWQSSGLGPHTITIQFFKLTKISKIYLLFNYLLDESYTPYEISIKVGNDENRLDVLCTTFCDVNKHPVDHPFWFIIDLANFQLHSYLYNYNMNPFKRMNFIYCRCIQICVMSSQHYGRDTRMRQVKIFGPTYPFYKHDKALIL
ncbi:anaphase promoting complex subunit 10, putative [Plasmodium knowlesi strain H]|uniref:Anaphase promoting complex subunit 10, putative n=3 Tax=Plasmodium knowlesi TaxID=5850 RepID=A0A5K1V995_PLAKH|nr:anaphase-promoting complex subunit 10, putative [Plasmodium knowlesi strain H]OTN63968.1 putative Anaphase promoting complex subunit 10 [Plasmodium knowlesi]CAA9990968.1 anaphase-promoting complex subunit 10, putative [Plasmodium knowlesi strain H]SBO20793.1 anaphase promoting complex subunit 10, putative [Plasmodium knowlesi strain H]SBO21231.1 anaphase promoting complex subunit 10, putative [Plasmodium knowlesi strain H]VVS80442.1 anaphase-promoting complex subunit 10, putative [Plasmodiu|eukprot:XP_002262251.1 hypothetical protein, conserved [Plasmodium knowlesi strain H]